MFIITFYWRFSDSRKDTRSWVKSTFKKQVKLFIVTFYRICFCRLNVVGNTIGPVTVTFLICAFLQTNLWKQALKPITPEQNQRIFKLNKLFLQKLSKRVKWNYNHNYYVFNLVKSKARGENFSLAKWSYQLHSLCK